MKNIRLLDTVEHRFVFEAGGEPVAKTGTAFEIARAEIPETDLIGAVWKIGVGSEVSVPDKDADKLIGLGYAEAI